MNRIQVIYDTKAFIHSEYRDSRINIDFGNQLLIRLHDLSKEDPFDKEYPQKVLDIELMVRKAFVEAKIHVDTSSEIIRQLQKLR